MNSYQSLLRTTFVFFGVLIALSALPQISTAAAFTNPLIKTENGGCLTDNLRNIYFSEDFNAEEQVKICRSIEKISLKLNSTRWSSSLNQELSDIWQVFSGQKVILRRMPKDTSPSILAMADPGQAFGNKEHFVSVIYLCTQKIESDSFLPIMIHELRHVYDFYQAWEKRDKLSSLEIERRGFLVMGKVARDSGLKAPGFPKFWKDKWRALPEAEAALKSQAEVDKYLSSVKIYRYLFDSSASVYDFTDSHDFTETKANVNLYGKLIPITSYKEQGPPQTESSIINAGYQEKQEKLIFDLEKPEISSDETNLLRIALENEKKLSSHLDRLIYDQKSQFQCLENGKITGTILSQGNNLRAQLFQPGQPKNALLALGEKGSPSCADDADPAKNELTHLFWARPELEKMDITFNGYVQLDNRKLAEYSVSKPKTAESDQLISGAAKSSFQGKIYISPEDAQIVRFYGTTSLFNGQSGRVTSGSIEQPDTLPVIAIRQKFNLGDGVWITSYVGTVSLDEKMRLSMPYRYSVSLQNFRRIADLEVRPVNQSVQTEQSYEPGLCGEIDEYGYSNGAS